MPATFTASRQAPYYVQALGEELREVIERHKVENPALADHDIQTAMQLAGRRASWLNVDNLQKARLIIGLVIMIGVGITIGNTFYKVYKTLHEHEGVMKALSDR